jgi:GNAT superfamily N-acetyltransferase
VAVPDPRVLLRKSEPIFVVTDVVATVGYYCSVLGFDGEWLWGEPPDFGGVRWAKFGVMFAQQSAPGAKVGGQWHSFFVDGIDALYDLHQQKGATICSPLESKPWGLREYTVRDLNGHFLRFGAPSSDRSSTSGRDPADAVAIVERLPAPEEFQALVQAVGWGVPRQDRAKSALAGARHGVVALDGDRAIGLGLVLGDGVSFAYLKDIVVHPNWQARGIGSRIVEALLEVIRRTAPDGILVTLFTGQNRAEFYERFGFCGPEMGLYGMSMQIRGSATLSKESSD